MEGNQVLYLVIRFRNDGRKVVMKYWDIEAAGRDAVSHLKDSNVQQVKMFIKAARSKDQTDD